MAFTCSGATQVNGKAKKMLFDIFRSSASLTGIIMYEISRSDGIEANDVGLWVVTPVETRKLPVTWPQNSQKKNSA